MEQIDWKIINYSAEKKCAKGQVLISMGQEQDQDARHRFVRRMSWNELFATF